MSRSTTTKWLIGIAAGGALIGAADANAASTCSYDPSTQIVSLTHTGAGASELAMEGNTLRYYDGIVAGNCISATGQSATSANTRSVLFTGSPGLPEDFIVSEFGGRFFGNGPGGQTVVHVFSGPEDTVDISGSDDRDYIGIRGGAGTGKQGQVLLNPTSTSEGTVRMIADPKLLRVNALNGDDQVNPIWMPYTTSMHLELHGGDGRDTLTGGLLGGDSLIGDAGDDFLFADDGQPGDNITAGTGVDTARVDSSDSAFGVEKFEKPTVGKLAFEPRLAHPGADGTTRIAFGWKHPKDWKQLRTVTLTARDATGAIGSITMRPKAGTAAARGAVKLAGEARLTHNGKWARAAMRVTAPAGTEGLAFDVTAVDTKGRSQTEHDAGRLVPRAQA